MASGSSTSISSLSLFLILCGDYQNFQYQVLPFPHHPKGIKGTPENHHFSKNILYNW
jgi:hypothetical protein